MVLTWTAGKPWKKPCGPARCGSIKLVNFNAAKIARFWTWPGQPARPGGDQPYWNQHALKQEFADEGFVYEGWYPLGHGDAGLLGLPLFAELGRTYGKTLSQVILRWQLQEGNVVFPKTLNPAHMAENLDVFDFELNEHEMAQIAALPQKPYYTVPEQAPDWVWGPNDYTQQA